MKFLISLCFLLATPQLFAKGGACKDDRAKLCKDIEKGQGRINNCLFNQWDKVSAPCKEVRGQGYTKWMARKTACGADIQKYCQEGSGAFGRGGKCLRQNKKNLSDSCKSFLKNQRSAHKQKLSACEGDIKTHCPNLEKGEGRTWKCLVENQAKLSEACKSEWPSLGRKAARAAKKAERMKSRAERKANKNK